MCATMKHTGTYRQSTIASSEAYNEVNHPLSQALLANCYVESLAFALNSKILGQRPLMLRVSQAAVASGVLLSPDRFEY